MGPPQLAASFISAALESPRILRGHPFGAPVNATYLFKEMAATWPRWSKDGRISSRLKTLFSEN
jgi:hypothetical protein